MEAGILRIFQTLLYSMAKAFLSICIKQLCREAI